jgi:hypothetical protein
MSKIYVFDLDGTLCDTNGTFYENAKPIPNRISHVNKLYEDGHTIIIETARGSHSGRNWWYFTVEQLKGWGLKFHTLRTGVKYSADFFVDDRGINDKDFFEKSNFSESGSGVNTKLILVNRVRKEASNERMEKLIDEVNFIKKIPSHFKKHFPEIVSHGVNEGTSYYEMQHYQLPSFRSLIFANQLSIEDVVYWMDKITKFSIELHEYETVDMPKNYMSEMHWDRYWTRKDELISKSKVFKDFFEQDEIIINNKNYIHPDFIINELQKIESDLVPEFVGRWSHSDLHFSNILIDRENDTFICIDPRGYDYCDPYYDFGKLWHSVNGKYEMVANGMWTIDGSNYSLSENNYYKFLEELKLEFPDKIFQKYSSAKNKDIMKFVEFNEAIHFITLVPFQLCHDGVEDKARVAFYVGVELLNDFYKKYVK